MIVDFILAAKTSEPRNLQFIFHSSGKKSSPAPACVGMDDFAAGDICSHGCDLIIECLRPFCVSFPFLVGQVKSYFCFTQKKSLDSFIDCSFKCLFVQPGVFIR